MARPQTTPARGRVRVNWTSPRPSSGSTLSGVHFSGSQHRPPTRTAQRARSVHPRPRNRAPACPARRSRRDSAVQALTGSTAGGHLCRGPGRQQRSSTGRRTRHRTPIARSQRSEIESFVCDYESSCKRANQRQIARLLYRLLQRKRLEEHQFCVVLLLLEFLFFFFI